MIPDFGLWDFGLWTIAFHKLTASVMTLFASGKNFARIDAFVRIAFEPRHFAVVLFGKPVLEFRRVIGRSRGRETAIVKPQFPGALPDGVVHGRADCTV